MQIQILGIGFTDQLTVYIEVAITYQDALITQRLVYDVDDIHDCMLSDMPNALETMVAESVTDMVVLQRALNIYVGRVISVDDNTDIVAITA